MSRPSRARPAHPSLLLRKLASLQAEGAVTHGRRSVAVAALLMSGLLGCRGTDSGSQAANGVPPAESASVASARSQASPAATSSSEGSGSGAAQSPTPATPREAAAPEAPPSTTTTAPGGAASTTTGSNAPAVPELYQMPVNTSAMVTVELDRGSPPLTVASAVASIERRHEPDDKTGRTFAVLDVTGEPTADGRKLRLQMHVSAEKPGLGALIDRRDGRILWHAAVIPAPGIQGVPKSLTILIEDGLGKTSTVDGSTAPTRILDANMRESGKSVRDFWADGDEREVSFIYSACGCPVKVLVRRTGDTTVRTSDRPLMFPDDPAVMQLIRRLMGWS